MPAYHWRLVTADTRDRFTPDLAGDAARAGAVRPEPRGDPGEDDAAAEGAHRRQLGRLHQQEPPERARRRKRLSPGIG